MNYYDVLMRGNAPLVVAYGLGVDSTAMLIEMQRRGYRPDAILFADTGDEKQVTYDLLPVMQEWCRKVGFPEITVVKNARPKSGDKSLSDSCLRLGTLPALAYGMHQCSLVWKRDPQHKWLKSWQPAIDAWADGLKVITAIGYDAGPRDSCRQYKAEGKESPGFANWFPLIDWGIDRERCEQICLETLGFVPHKSACFHCPASKKWEIDFLRETAPEQFQKAMDMESGAHAKGLKRIKGLGRNFSWTEYAQGS